jgi:hypothetical protein
MLWTVGKLGIAISNAPLLTNTLEECIDDSESTVICEKLDAYLGSVPFEEEENNILVRQLLRRSFVELTHILREASSMVEQFAGDSVNRDEAAQILSLIRSYIQMLCRYTGRVG